MQREEVKKRILSGISCLSYLDKGRHGGIKCPFCGSGSKSNGTGAVKYYDETNTWYCHSCHTGGDVLDLIMHEYSIDYNTALQHGAEQLGITIDKWNGGTIERTEAAAKAPADEQPAEQDYTEYYKVCAARLANSAAALAYLKKRGISLETAKALNIGYDPKADPAGTPGAIDPSNNKHPVPRIIIPTSKSHYIGRSIDPNTLASWAKINNKGGRPHIFNAAALYNSDVVFVVEGAFDAMSYAEVGAAAIALNSTANVNKLLELLKEQLAPAETKFVVSLDNDINPKTAAETESKANELLKGLQELGYRAIKYTTAGSYKDANELLQADKGKLVQQVNAALAALNAADEQPAEQDFIATFLDKVQTDIYKPIPTGLSFFDDLLNGGIMPQTLLTVLAKPGIGKTTLCQQLAEEMAAHQKPIVYINLEMSREQLFAKALSYRLAKTGQHKTALEILQGFNWTDTDRQQITAAADKYRKEIFPYLQYNPRNIGSDIDTILTYLQELGEQAKKSGKQAPAVVLDYIHLCSTTKKLDEQELLKYVVTGLKKYAINYNTFAIAISAINRASGDNIELASGRGSSNIEYTGDYQLALNYHDKANTAAEDKKRQQQHWRRLDLRVLKGRLIPLGKIAHLYFNAANNIFYGEYDAMPIDNSRIPFECPLDGWGVSGKKPKYQQTEIKRL